MMPGLFVWHVEPPNGLCAVHLRYHAILCSDKHYSWSVKTGSSRCLRRIHWAGKALHGCSQDFAMGTKGFLTTVLRSVVCESMARKRHSLLGNTHPTREGVYLVSAVMTDDETDCVRDKTWAVM